MVECGICLEEYQEGNLQLHQEMCVVRLIFRCSLCDEDYMSKEGLWNHLDLHEIVDESKELHYQEIKAKHKLHQCVLCNDQRAYSESPYWKHVHDVHDGFFLRCSDCGQNFRSEQLRNDHAISLCKARDQMEEEQVSTEFENMTSDAQHVKLSRDERTNIAHEELTNRLSERSHVDLSTTNEADKNNIDKNSKMPIIRSTKNKALSSRFACDICGVTFSSRSVLLRHKKAKYSCMKGRQRMCPYCRKKIQINEYRAHFSLCEQKKFSCELCSLKFKASAYLINHMRNVHRQKGVLNNEKQDKNQVKNHAEETTNVAGKTTRSSGPETILSSSDSSSSSNVVEDRDISTVKKDISDKSTQLLAGNPSGTKCSYCDKECANASILRSHIKQTHQPTKCSICGITLGGYSQASYHKMMKHMKPKYECAKCSKKFHFVYDYKRHSNVCNPSQRKKDRSVKIVVPPRPKCSYCGMNESSAATLAQHILIQHSPVACAICGITLSSLFQAHSHMKKMHKKSNLKCPHCSMRFPGRVGLQKHVAKCETEKVPCEFCGKTFKDAIAVTIHWSTFCHAYKRSKEQVQKNAETSLCDETLVESGLSKTKCCYCIKEFSNPGHLNHHLQSFHELTKCDSCGMTVLGILPAKKYKMKCHHDATQYQKEVQKNDLNMEITEEKTIISVRDDQRQSTVNPTSKVDVPNSRSNEHSIANFNDDDSMDSRIIDKESVMDSVSPLDGSSERQVVSEKTSQPLVENLSNGLYSCNICAINFHTYSKMRHHKLTKHMEETFQCPHCSRKFHYKVSLNYHTLCCVSLKYSCDLCGQKFNIPGGVEKHKKLVHRGNRTLRNAHIEDADGTEEPKQNSVEKMDAAQEITSCNICNITFASTDGLLKHKLSCPKPTKKHDDSQFGAEQISLLHGEKEAQTNSTIAPQDDDIELKLEIKVEEPALQEQEYQVPNEDPGRSFAATLHPHGGKSKDVEAEDAEDLENGIKVKEEYPEDEQEIIAEHQTKTDALDCQEGPSDRKEYLLRPEVMDVHSKVLKRKLNS